MDQFKEKAIEIVESLASDEESQQDKAAVRQALVPNVETVKESAERCEYTYKSMRFKRAQKTFQDKTHMACLTVAHLLLREVDELVKAHRDPSATSNLGIVKSGTDFVEGTEGVAQVLRYFNQAVVKAFAEGLLKRIDGGGYEWALVGMALRKHAVGPEDWRETEGKELTRILLKAVITDLADPNLDPEAREALAEEARGMIDRLL